MQHKGDQHFTLSVGGLGRLISRGYITGGNREDRNVNAIHHDDIELLLIPNEFTGSILVQVSCW